MSTLFDETAADIPVRDTTITLSRVAASPQAGLLVYQNARARQDFSRVPREELEDRFLRLHEENLQLKQHIHKQDDKIKKLGTKLMKLVKDRSRLEQLAVGGGQRVSRVRDVEMEEMIEELQDKVRALQRENEGLKQRLLVAKQQLINKQSRRPTPYSHIQSRVSTGLKKPQDDASSPSLIRPKSAKSLEAGGRPPTGLLPRFGHSLVEEARAEIRNLENVIEHQRSQMEEMERTSEMLQEDLRNMKAEYEQKLLQARQQQSSKLRSYIDDNVMMIKLQKQLSDKCNAVTELEGRFIHLQECQRILKTSHDAAIMKVDELSAQLRDERKKGLDLKKQLQSCTITNVRMEQLQERLQDVEQERDLLKESNAKLIDSTFDVSQQQKWQIQEQQLKLQISQLEMALRADLADKNEILDKIKAERDTSEKLTEENKKLHIELLEQKQQLDDLNGRFKFYNRDVMYNPAELTEALLLIKSRKSQKDVEMAEEGAGSVRELRAAHAETILELEKTRKILSMESKICKDYKVELEVVLKKMDSDRAKYEQKLEQQAQLLDTRAAKINKLEAQIRDIAYGSKTHVFKPNITDEQEAEEETLDLNRGDNLLEVQIVGATLSPPSLEMLGDHEPSTFCTYAFYLFELHSTPVVTGHNPKYGFTSKYVVNMDDRFLDYVHRCSVTVELHQALGLDWRTVASAQLPLQQLLEHDGKVHGSAPLFGTSDEIRSFGSVDYWLRLRVPMTETIRLYKEKVKAVGYIHSALSPDKQLQPADSSGWNELYITVQSCRDLQFSGPQQPSPYVVYKFSNFPDHPTTTVHDSCHPHFNDLKSYSVPMDVDLDQYLKSELIQFYVFDYKEEQMDVYMGKARVALLPLAQDQEIAGDYELTDLSGLPAGHIEVTLKWKSAYFPPSGSTRTTVERTFIQKERVGQAKQELHRLEDKAKEEALQKEEEEVRRHHSLLFSQPEDAMSQAPLLKSKQKKVMFVGPDATDVTHQVEDRSSAGESLSAEKIQTTSSPVVKDVSHSATQSTEEEEEESHISEGQLVPVSSHSDDSEISEDITEDVEMMPAAKEDQSESTHSDSDDCIVQGQAAGRKPLERIRVEVLSLSLRPEGWVALDSSVVRLFVEYSLLDLPTEETPLSLPKPPPGKSINYNYSKVVPVDAEKNSTRRQLLRAVLQGRNPHMERIRFTVVSEPPEEEEQERDCEDVGVAFLRIPDILEKQQDLTETSLNVMGVEDSSEVLGSLTVTVEGLEALQAIMQDKDQERTPVSSLLPSA